MFTGIWAPKTCNRSGSAITRGDRKGTLPLEGVLFTGSGHVSLYSCTVFN